MSNFTPLVKFSLEFEGDSISMDLRRLKREAILKLSPYLTTNEQGKVTGLSFEDQTKFTNVMIEILPSYVTNFSGLVDAIGNLISLEDMIQEAYFQSLVSHIVSKLLLISSPDGGEEKN